MQKQGLHNRNITRFEQTLEIETISRPQNLECSASWGNLFYGKIPYYETKVPEAMYCILGYMYRAPIEPL